MTDTSTFARKQCYTLLAPDACYNGKLEYTIVKSTADKLIDIIWAVDTSGSMSEESAAVQANLNAFAAFINNAEVDYRVVLISDDSICVPTPLAGPNCGDSERFRHIDSEVYSTDALEKIISNYSKFANFLRPHAQTHFVVVSDDNSSKSAKWFTDQAYLKDNFSAPFVFHSVVGAGPDPNGCPTAADEGTVYLQLSNKTGGGVYPICSTDWSGVYSSLADVVVQAVCGFPITHYTALSNADTVYLKHSLDGQEASLPQVATAEDCNGPGFYALAEPPLVVLCPDSCETLLEGKLKLQWVCPE